MGEQVFFENYSPVGDLTTVAVCIVIFILIATSYVKRTKNFYIFVTIVVYLMLAGLSDVFYHNLYGKITNGNYNAVYIIRVFYHALLFSNLLLYVVYIIAMQNLERKKSLFVRVLAMVIYFVVIITDIVSVVNGTSFKLKDNAQAFSAQNVFLYGYIGFIAIIVYLLIVSRRLFYRRVMWGFYGTIGMSFLILLMQGRHGQSSFTVASFLFPVIAMLYIIHSNPYENIEIGTVDTGAFEDMVSRSYRKKKDFIFTSLYLPELDVEGKSIPHEIYETIRRFSADYFKGTMLFQISSGHIILTAWKDSNPDYRDKIDRILEAFRQEYLKYMYDYKIVIGSSIEEISRGNEGLSFINSIHRRMKINDIYTVTLNDVDRFNEQKYILSELIDIFKKKDLDDPRILVYCQPVYSIKRDRYDTAEALMRLSLPNLGLVYPDKFISLAEDNGFIHVLTQIILKKTCDGIRKLLDNGYDLRRISVNVSALEMRDDSFTNDVDSIIKQSGIPDEKIAFEITESRSETDFMALKNKIDEMKERGIKFYLDDFGTGYSNMERILELPFDIIKFDRSLVLASGSNERSRKMVGSLASMFSNVDYSVLYEGIENDQDEERCINMSASYLQGYKYSKPIPIEELTGYFTKGEA